MHRLWTLDTKEYGELVVELDDKQIAVSYDGYTFGQTFETPLAAYEKWLTLKEEDILVVMQLFHDEVYGTEDRIYH